MQKAMQNHLLQKVRQLSVGYLQQLQKPQGGAPYSDVNVGLKPIGIVLVIVQIYLS